MIYILFIAVIFLKIELICLKSEIKEEKPRKHLTKREMLIATGQIPNEGENPSMVGMIPKLPKKSKSNAK